MALYCDEADLYNHGMPRGGPPNPGRRVSAVSPAADVLTLDLHGLVLNAEIRFRAEGGGALPGGLSAGVVFYAIPLSGSTFQVAAAVDGPAIDITSSGQNVMLIVPVNFEAAIEWASAIIDDSLPAHAVPLEAPYPPIVRMTVAELAANYLMAGVNSPSLTAIADAAIKRVGRWAKHIPIRGTNAPTTHTSVAQSASAPYADPRKWNRYGGL
jgi:hypothetical protein